MNPCLTVKTIRSSLLLSVYHARKGLGQETPRHFLSQPLVEGSEQEKPLLRAYQEGTLDRKTS